MLSLPPVVLLTISCMRGEWLTYAERRALMTATITQVVKPLQQDWTNQLAPEAILAACRGVAYRGRVGRKVWGSETRRT